MGIDNFHSWLRTNYSEAYIDIKGNNIYDFIYIDLNYILHNSIYNVKSEKEFLNKLYLQLDLIFSNFIATKQIFFALDGPSSYAKIILQRKRRSKITENKDNDQNTITSLWFTPGVQKMKTIEEYIKLYINRLKKYYKHLNPIIEISLSNEADEGEIKLFRQLLKNTNNNTNLTNLIIGNDSDLIALSMAVKPIYNINILIKSKNQNELVSIKCLLQLYATHIQCKKNIHEISTSNIRDDFVIISIMMGNDYLPKLKFINHINLWNYYTEFIIDRDESLIQDDNFNINTMSAFMYYIYTKLSNNFKKITIKTFNNERAKSYLRGLLWCLKMYKYGECPNYTYAYDNDESPHPYELLLYLCSTECKEYKYEHIKTESIPSELYPLLVMPKKAQSFIHEKYKNLIDNELKYLYEAEDCNFCKDYKKKSNELIKLINEDESEIHKYKYNSLQNNYIKHKKIHYTDFTINDINNIINFAKKNNI